MSLWPLTFLCLRGARKGGRQGQWQDLAGRMGLGLEGPGDFDSARLSFCVAYFVAAPVQCCMKK